jgi:hypothetical protein
MAKEFQLHVWSCGVIGIPQKINEGFRMKRLQADFAKDAAVLFLNGNSMQAGTLLEAFDDNRFNVTNKELSHADTLISTLSPVKLVLIPSQLQ